MSKTNYKNAFASFLTGLIFSVGLGISGMTMPSKVLGFLDLFGNFDPSLIFVMGGAIGVHAITYRLVRRNEKPLWDQQWHVPTKTDITPSLIAGAFIFGFGWALGGMCPGPAIVRLASFETNTIIFIISMITGMFIFRSVDKKLKFNK